MPSECRLHRQQRTDAPRLRLNWIARAVLGIALLCLASPAAAQAVIVDEDAYARELERIIGRVKNADAAQIPELIAAVPPAWTVHVDGEPLQLSSAWVTRVLEEASKNPGKWAEHRARLIARLTAVRTEVSAPRPEGAAADLDRARRVSAEVLRRDEFRRYAADGAIQKLRKRITDWFLALWDRMGGNRYGTRAATKVVAWVAALSALAAMSWWLLSRLLGPSARSGLALTPPSRRRRSARAWARDAATAPDLRDVVRFAYRAAIVSLEEEGAWRVDEARTPREHLRLLPSTHRRRAIFADLARRFEDIWFGARIPTVDDRHAVLSRLEELGCLSAD